MQAFFHDLIVFMVEGGLLMWVIAAVWIIGLVIAFEKYTKLFSYDIDAPSLMNELQKYVLSGDVQGGIKVCSRSKALLPRVLKSGLKRSNQSIEQVQSAIDATCLEVIPKIEKRLGHLALIANLSTLFGLLGTIQGLIQSFSAVSKADPSQKGELLAKGIAVAMNTTALGLISAITILIVHAFLVSKSEKIISNIDEYSVKLIDMLGAKKES